MIFWGRNRCSWQCTCQKKRCAWQTSWNPKFISMGLCNFLDVPSHFGMKYDRPWNMVKKLLELFNAQSKLKKIRCYAEHVTKWQEMIFFLQQHCRQICHIFDGFDPNSFKQCGWIQWWNQQKIGLKCWKPIQYYQVVASKKSCRLPALRQLRRSQQKVVVHLWLRRNIGRVIRSHRYHGGNYW